MKQQRRAGKVNPWMKHVKECKAKKINQGKPYKDILKEAKLTYKK